MRNLNLFVLSVSTALAGIAGCSPAPERPTSPTTPTTPTTPTSPTSPTSPGKPPAGNIVVGNDPCKTDADCVPSGCCHPAACGAKASAPDCSAVMCTQECRPATLDCGGSCLCVEGKCAARLNDLGAGGPASAP